MGNEFKVRLNNTTDVALFCAECSKFTDADIDYKVGRYVVDGKSIVGLLSTTLGNVAIVKINTDDTEIINNFISSTKLWIVKQ